MDFRLLYRRYARSTFAFFLRRLGDPESAADLNQELFLRVSRSMEKFEGRSSWRTWIFVIARNVLAEHRSQRWNRLGDRTVVLEVEALRRDLSHGVNPDDAAGAVLLRHRLRSCLRRLDDLARAVILGHYFAGVTLRELTEQLELTNASGARAVLISAQRKLRRCLEQWGQE
jgi:RNA polymerase sigma-70 factor (ECF subfamily)